MTAFCDSIARILCILLVGQRPPDDEMERGVFNFFTCLCERT